MKQAVIACKWVQSIVKNECPNQCYGRFQDLIDKLFEDAMKINTDAQECP